MLKEPSYIKRRRLVSSTAGQAGSGVLGDRAETRVDKPPVAPVAELPEMLGGMSLEALRQDCRRRLFEQYLPFWEKGAYDPQRGGFTCELSDDGSVTEDEKFLWYQGRGLWAYSFLYNNLQPDPHWLRIAATTRDFMVKHMYAKEGKWIEKVRRDGAVLEGVGTSAFTPLYAAGGLAQYYAITRDPGDLALIKQSIWAAVKSYEDPAYTDKYVVPNAAIKVPAKGLRTQGHSFVLVWALSQLLSVHQDPQLAELQRKHIDILVNRFWNPDYGIVNEYLQHDYSRLPGAESYMHAGFTLETLWILLCEALRTKDQKLFDCLKTRARRLLEMCWDYTFDGWAGGDFFVSETRRHQWPDYNVKTMWAQCEAMGACLTILEYTGEAWAKQWYEGVRAFTLATMPVAEHGVWRQAVDRRGKDLQRVGISTKRKDNFHQVRMLMMNLQSLDRMVQNQRARTPFPQ